MKEIFIKMFLSSWGVVYLKYIGVNVFRPYFLMTPRLYGKKSKFLKTGYIVAIIL